MADIAILVAEEYERRGKNTNCYPSGGSEAEGERQISYLLSVWVEKKAIAEDRWLQNLNLGGVFKPKTDIGQAAFRGFFSA